MKKINKFLVFFIPATIILLFIYFYQKMKSDIGNAAVKSIKVYNEIKTDLETKNLNLIDTLENKSHMLLDTIKENKKKSKIVSDSIISKNNSVKQQ